MWVAALSTNAIISTTTSLTEATVLPATTISRGSEAESDLRLGTLIVEPTELFADKSRPRKHAKRDNAHSIFATRRALSPLTWLSVRQTKSTRARAFITPRPPFAHANDLQQTSLDAFVRFSAAASPGRDIHPTVLVPTQSNEPESDHRSNMDRASDR